MAAGVRRVTGIGYKGIGGRSMTVLLIRLVGACWLVPRSRGPTGRVASKLWIFCKMPLG